jgi:S-adenosylmethionine/arginine decarboxylase-like enzyme
MPTGPRLAPHIVRQRLLIEAYYQAEVDHGVVARYLQECPAHLNLRIYSDPVVYSPGGDGKTENQGYDGFVALIDSGISIYIWENAKFLSVVIYTCKAFVPEAAKTFTAQFFQTTEMTDLSF